MLCPFIICIFIKLNKLFGINHVHTKNSIHNDVIQGVSGYATWSSLHVWIQNDSYTNPKETKKKLNKQWMD